jgi:hypothetical protein
VGARGLKGGASAGNDGSLAWRSRYLVFSRMKSSSARATLLTRASPTRALPSASLCSGSSFDNHQYTNGTIINAAIQPSGTELELARPFSSVGLRVAGITGNT